MENTVVVTTVTSVKTEEDEVCDRRDIVFENVEIGDESRVKIEKVEHGIEELHHSIEVIPDDDELNETSETSNSKNTSMIAADMHQNNDDCSEEIQSQNVEIEKSLSGPKSQAIYKTAEKLRIKRKREILARSRIVSSDLILAKLELVRFSTSVLRKESERRRKAENVENKLKLQILKMRKNAVIVQNKVKLQILKVKLEIKKAKLNKLLQS